MGHDCPTSGKELRTEQRMRQHHTKVHGESLPNQTCKGCSTEFYDEKARLSYCDGCNPNAGEHNGNWSDAKETAECRLCNDEFEYYPSDKDGVFCPSCVEEAEAFLGTPSYELREMERVERTCENCGVVSEYLKSTVEYGYGRFCSHECKSRWMSENWQGPDHHGWKGGTDRSWYTGSWARIRKEARERDSHACRLCGKSKAEMGREPDVHHINPVRRSMTQRMHTGWITSCVCAADVTRRLKHRGVDGAGTEDISKHIVSPRASGSQQGIDCSRYTTRQSRGVVANHTSLWSITSTD